MLYMLSAVLKRYEDEGRPVDMLPIVHWSCQHMLFELQKALDGVIVNFPNRFMAFVMRLLVFPLGRGYREPDDKLRHEVAELLLSSEDVRNRLAKGIYLSPEGDNLLYKLNDTVKQLDATLDIEARILKAQRNKVIFGYDFPDCIKAAKKEGIISVDEEKQMASAYQAMMDIINVDDFDPAELTKKAAKETTAPAITKNPTPKAPTKKSIKAKSPVAKASDPKAAQQKTHTPKVKAKKPAQQKTPTPKVKTKKPKMKSS
jgi:acyl-CoA dehydrogenase